MTSREYVAQLGTWRMSVSCFFSDEYSYSRSGDGGRWGSYWTRECPHEQTISS